MNVEPKDEAIVTTITKITLILIYGLGFSHDYGKLFFCHYHGPLRREHHFNLKPQLFW
jgi:hypothetical protein